MVSGFRSLAGELFHPSTSVLPVSAKLVRSQHLTDGPFRFSPDRLQDSLALLVRAGGTLADLSGLREHFLSNLVDLYGGLFRQIEAVGDP